MVVVTVSIQPKRRGNVNSPRRSVNLFQRQALKEEKEQQ
jgi:hypothetical protein